ncbi:unnamed protein product, partial [Thlaspi arvense]
IFPSAAVGVASRRRRESSPFFPLFFSPMASYLFALPPLLFKPHPDPPPGKPSTDLREGLVFVEPPNPPDPPDLAATFTYSLFSAAVVFNPPTVPLFHLDLGFQRLVLELAFLVSSRDSLLTLGCPPSAVCSPPVLLPSLHLESIDAASPPPRLEAFLSLPLPQGALCRKTKVMRLLVSCSVFNGAHGFTFSTMESVFLPLGGFLSLGGFVQDNTVCSCLDVASVELVSSRLSLVELESPTHTKRKNPIKSKLGKGYTYRQIQTDLIAFETCSSLISSIPSSLLCELLFETMDYDIRNKSGPPYGRPMYGPPSTSPSPASSHPMYAPSPSGYPKIGQQSGHGQPFFPPPERNSSFQHSSSPFPPSSSSSGLGIKVTLKPEYRITPPPHLLPRAGDIPRSGFQFDFGLEKKVLAEAEKDNPDWSKFGTENPPPANFPDPPTPSAGVDPVVMKYAASGLNREAVSIAVANYGDNPTKVQEFANGFTAIREMGFPTNAVADALFMFENDTEKALAHLLHGST